MSRQPSLRWKPWHRPLTSCWHRLWLTSDSKAPRSVVSPPQWAVQQEQKEKEATRSTCDHRNSHCDRTSTRLCVRYSDCRICSFQPHKHILVTWGMVKIKALQETRESTKLERHPNLPSSIHSFDFLFKSKTWNMTVQGWLTLMIDCINEIFCVPKFCLDWCRYGCRNTANTETHVCVFFFFFLRCK